MTGETSAISRPFDIHLAKEREKNHASINKPSYLTSRRFASHHITCHQERTPDGKEKVNESTDRHDTSYFSSNLFFFRSVTDQFCLKRQIQASSATFPNSFVLDRIGPNPTGHTPHALHASNQGRISLNNRFGSYQVESMGVSPLHFPFPPDGAGSIHCHTPFLGGGYLIK